MRINPKIITPKVTKVQLKKIKKDNHQQEKKSNIQILFEKRLNLNKEEEDKHEEEERMKKHFRNERNTKMVEKYNNRIRKFTLDMIDKPVFINNLQPQVVNTRADYFEENSNKILANKGFIYSKYITEKERLRQMNDFKKEQEEKEMKIKQENENNKNKLTIEDKVLIGLIKQPQLRFKPRTHLERIVDGLSIDNKMTSIEKRIVTKQIKSLKGDNPFSNKVYLITPDNLNLFKKETAGTSLKRGKLRVDNHDAKKILRYLHNKTYFKGVSSICNINRSKFNMNMNINTNSNIPNSVSTINSPNNNNASNKSNNIKKKLIEQGFSSKNQIKEDIFFPSSQNDFYKNKNEDETEFKLNYNPLVKFEENVVDYNKLRRAKYLYTRDVNKENDDHNETKENGNASRYPSLIKKLVKSRYKNKYNQPTYKSVDYNEDIKKDEEKVVIDSETINKDDLDKIALRILKKCNYSQKKNKNNNIIHESRTGKTCITNGLSVKDFEKEKGLDYFYFKN